MTLWHWLIDLNVSSWSEPDFGWWGKSGIELIVEVAEPFIIILVSALVVGVGGVPPPPVEEEGEEEGHDEPGVKTMSVSVEDAVTLKGASSSP